MDIYCSIQNCYCIWTKYFLSIGTTTGNCVLKRKVSKIMRIIFQNWNVCSECENSYRIWSNWMVREQRRERVGGEGERGNFWNPHKVTLRCLLKYTLSYFIRLFLHKFHFTQDPYLPVNGWCHSQGRKLSSQHLLGEIEVEISKH